MFTTLHRIINRHKFAFYRIYTSILSTYENLLPSFVKGSLAVAVLDLCITGLLFAGLLTRKAGLMLPWLGTSMLYLCLFAAFFLGFTVIQFTVVKSCSAGLITLGVGSFMVMAYYYVWKVVQSEWMNIREAATRTGEVWGKRTLIAKDVVNQKYLWISFTAVEQ